VSGGGGEAEKQAAKAAEGIIARLVRRFLRKAVRFTTDRLR